MSDRTANEAITVHVQCRSIDLPNGRKVRGGYDSNHDAYYWEFTACDGVITTLCLTDEAMEAVIVLYSHILRRKVDGETEKEQQP